MARQRRADEAGGIYHALNRDCMQRVNSPLTDSELEAIRKCAQRGQPLGSQNWIEQLVQRLGLPTSKRPRGRPRKSTSSINET